MAGAKSVLVIDDEPVLQDVLGSLLEGNGFDYHQAYEDAEALRVKAEFQCPRGLGFDYHSLTGFRDGEEVVLVFQCPRGLGFDYHWQTRQKPSRLL